ncbi:DUF3107 domain-containing protein [Aeromicrobium alkaliterrae]|uniref:DUF3107 domain-containing protein n=1 Tax=Aeromicrobium alkaliterrae TaxID=302168 RepID=A0ABP4VUN2_9ACTN
MEVKIGVQNAARELSLDTSSSPDDVLSELNQAIADSSVFSMTDDKGTTVAVPADKIAYVLFTGDTGRAVGFGHS